MRGLQDVESLGTPAATEFFEANGDGPHSCAEVDEHRRLDHARARRLPQASLCDDDRTPNALAADTTSPGGMLHARQQHRVDIRRDPAGDLLNLAYAGHRLEHAPPKISQQGLRVGQISGDLFPGEDSRAEHLFPWLLVGLLDDAKPGRARLRTGVGTWCLGGTVGMGAA